MLQQFLNHIQRHCLCKTSDKILLAVSGGVDSMVMLDLFIKAGFTVGVAHCNFQLRGKESDADEDLVKSICKLHNISLHTMSFDTSDIARERKQSIQLVARELRYNYFHEIVSIHGYQTIATAHHLNDNIETIFLNLIRGTGMEGLRGIPVQNGLVIRPLLFATRAMMLAYAAANSITWREDSSNIKEDYHRNFVRHQVIPRLKEVNPSLENTIQDTIERIIGGHELMHRSLKAIREDICLESANRIAFDQRKLKNYPSPAVILWELLKEYGFNYDQCKLILEEHQSGSRFLSEKGVLTVDRDTYILNIQRTALPLESVSVLAGQKEVIANKSRLRINLINRANFALKKDSAIAQLDVDKLHFPLCWRPWKAGDTLIPLGMETEKKVSDLLIDLKIPLPDKDKITVLESGGKIVWVVGIRVSEPYKVTPDTKNVIIIECD